MWPDWMLASGLDFIRSAGHSYGKGFWIGELQAGQGVSGMRIAQPVTAQNEAVLAVAGDLARSARNGRVCVVPDELGLRIERIRLDKPRRLGDRSS